MNPGLDVGAVGMNCERVALGSLHIYDVAAVLAKTNIDEALDVDEKIVSGTLERVIASVGEWSTSSSWSFLREISLGSTFIYLGEIYGQLNA
eukprot:692603-Amorphochlora_amoeboformis.AAC.1